MLGIVLLVTGIVMICVLRLNFQVYYNEFKCILWLAAIGMAVPMFFRGVINLMVLESSSFETWYYDHISFANTLFVVLSTFIPIVAQMFSLIFGFTRRSRDKKMTKAFDK